MTEPRGDQGFAVAPRRIGDDPGGRGPRRVRRLRMAIVVAVAAAIVAIAWLGPRLANRPSFELSFFATPTPAVTPSPSPTPTQDGVLSPESTPLPAVTRPDGVAVSGRIAIMGDGFRVLDAATGTVTNGPPVDYGRDAVFRAPNGDGWLCICSNDSTADDGEYVRTIDILGIEPTGAVNTGANDALTIKVPNDGTGLPDLLTDVDVFGGGRRGLLAVAKRAGEAWQFSVASVDVDGRTAGPLVKLGVVTPPEASPSPAPSVASPPPPGDPQLEPSSDLFVDGPHVRVSPDGRLAFVWGIIMRQTPDGVSTLGVHAWRVELDASGSVGKIRAVPGFAGLPPFCNAVAFATSERLAWMCPAFSSDPSVPSAGGWVIGIIDLDGRAGDSIDVTSLADGFWSEPLFDRANGQIYAWNPIGLSIARFDVRTLVQETVTLDPAARAFEGVAPGGGTDRPDWRDADSAVRQLGDGQLAGSPDGSRIYAVGFGPAQTETVDSSQASLGIFVFDRSTLALVDRWAPAANYLSVSMTSDGNVAAAGLPGVDEHGHPAPWEGSLTIHDAAAGRILIRFGQLGEGFLPLAIQP